MHELGVVQYLVSMAEDYARDEKKKVAYLLVEIGEMTGIIPKYVKSYYPDCIEGTLLEGSDIKIEEAQALAFCRKCGNTFNPGQTKERCPACHAHNYEVVDGKQFLLKQIAFIDDGG